MNNRHVIYGATVAIFICSVLVAAFLPVGEIIRDLSAVPAVGALLAALFQIFRDISAHEKADILQQSQNAFSIGSTSHMANVAFDMHVSFCEEYVEELWKAVDTLFREGPTRDALIHSTALYKIQRKYALWLNPGLEQELERFEAAVRRIGATAGLVYDSPGEKDRNVKIDEMFSLFAEVVGLEEWKGEQLTEDLAVTAVIGKLRKVLGIEELTRLRSMLVVRSLENLETKGKPVLQSGRS